MHIKPFVLPLVLLIWPNNYIYKKAWRACIYALLNSNQRV